MAPSAGVSWRNGSFPRKEPKRQECRLPVPPAPGSSDKESHPKALVSTGSEPRLVCQESRQSQVPCVGSRGQWEDASSAGPSDPRCSSRHYGNWTGIQAPTEALKDQNELSHSHSHFPVPLSTTTPRPEHPPFPLLEQTLLFLESSTAIALDLSLGTQTVNSTVWENDFCWVCVCRTPALHSWLPPTPHSWGVSEEAQKTCNSRGGSNSLAQTP